MGAVRDLLALVRDERDAVLPFFDSYAQLGDAYAELDRLAFGAEFQEAWGAAGRPPNAPDLGKKLEELAAARGRLLQMAMAFAAERKEGKWPELLRQDAQVAVRRLDAAIDDLQAS
jgi:hypothetical protein